MPDITRSHCSVIWDNVFFICLSVKFLFSGMTHEGILAGPLEKSVKLSTLDKQKNTKRNANQSESDEAGAQ